MRVSFEGKIQGEQIKPFFKHLQTVLGNGEKEKGKSNNTRVGIL